MGFTSQAQFEEFMLQAPDLEGMLVQSGLHLVKFWFSVSRSEQRTRFLIRQIEPVRRWKLSPMDLASLDRWDDYTQARKPCSRHGHSSGTLDSGQQQGQGTRSTGRHAPRPAPVRLPRQGPHRGHRPGPLLVGGPAWDGAALGRPYRADRGIEGSGTGTRAGTGAISLATGWPTPVALRPKWSRADGRPR